MVSEWEKEQLGRLTLRNLKAVPSSQPTNGGRMTHQNLQQLRGAHKRGKTRGEHVKLLLEKIKTALTFTLAWGLREKPAEAPPPTMCREYGHTIPLKAKWHGAYPTCTDCGEEITDVTQLRGALTKQDKVKYYSV